MSRRGLIALTLLSAVSLVVLAVVAGRRDDDPPPVAIVEGQQRPFRGNELPGPLERRPAPRFQLADARGGVLSSQDLKGKPYVLTFLYTDCADVCPLIGSEIRQALRLLGREAPAVAAVAVTVDPENDTPTAVMAWLRKQRMPANFHYLLGQRGRLEPLWRAYFAAPQPAGVRESKHTASIWLVDARGRLRTKFSGGVPVAPADMAHDLRLLVRESRSGRGSNATTGGPR